MKTRIAAVKTIIQAQISLAGEFNIEISTLALRGNTQVQANESLTGSLEEAQHKLDNLLNQINERSPIKVN